MLVTNGNVVDHLSEDSKNSKTILLVSSELDNTFYDRIVRGDVSPAYFTKLHFSTLSMAVSMLPYF